MRKLERHVFQCNHVTVVTLLTPAEGGSPFHECAGPGQTAPEDDHKDIIAFLDSASSVGFIESNGNSGGGCVSVSMEVHKKSIDRNFEAIGDCFDDSNIGLVWNDARNVVDGESSLVEHLLRGGQHGGNGLFVNVLAGHVDGLEIVVSILACNWSAAPAPWHEKNVGKLSVTAHVTRDYSMRAAAMLEEHCAGAISEEDTGIAIGPISYRSEFLSADYENRFVGMRRDKLLTDFQGTKEAGASRRNIETSSLGCADLCLDEASSSWKHHIGSRGGDENQFDIAWRDSSLFDRCQSSFCCHVAGIFVFAGYSPLFDSGTRSDPLVARVDYSGEILIIQNLVRHITASADDRNRLSRLTGARARARLSFHDNG